MAEMSEKDKKLLGFLGVIVVCYGIYAVIMPMKDDYHKRLKLIETKVAKLKEAHRQSNNLVELEKELQKSQQLLVELKKNLPEEINTLEIIESMNDLAKQSKLQTGIDNLSFGAVRERGPGWEAVPMSLSFRAAWHQFIIFLWKLETYERVIDVRTITFSEAGAKESDIQLYDIKLKAYVYASAE